MMICQSCGTPAEGPGKFCAKCGGHLPDQAVNGGQAGFSAAPPPPPAWSGAATPPPPAPAWSGPQAAPPPAAYPAPQQQFAPPPAYAAQPAYAAPAYAAAPAQGNPAMLAGLIALIGGVAAVGSAWLPWTATSSGDALLRPIQVTASMSDLANGYYLVGAGAVAAVVGLLLLVGLGRAAGARMLFGLVAIIAGVALLAVTYTAYGHVNDQITYFGASQVKLGNAIYAGAAGGIAAIVGGLLALIARR
jgi:hypothetical protein